MDVKENLKLKLLAEGVRVSPSGAAAWSERYTGPLTLAEYATTGGVAIVLPGELYVNAPVVEAEDTPLFDHDGEQFLVRDNGYEVPVGVVPVPAFHDRELKDSITGELQPYSAYGVTHTDRCRVSPIEGCAWKCDFCDLPFEFAYRKKQAADMIEVIRAAEVDEQSPARHVLISGGTPRAPRGARPGRPASDDEAWIDAVYAEIAAESPIPVDVMMPPRADLEYPGWLRSTGVNMISINLEISDPDRAKQIAPVKARIGRDHALAYIARAVEEFGVGFVQSLLVFGSAIEPMESTLKGVQDLVDRGCIPVLSPFRPHHLTPLRDQPAASYEEIVEVYERAMEICDRAQSQIWPGPRCIPCHHNTVALPLEGDFYIRLDDDLTAP